MNKDAISEEDAAYDYSFWQWKAYADIRGGSLERVRQTTVGNSQITHHAVLRALCTGFLSRVELSVVNILILNLRREASSQTGC